MLNRNIGSRLRQARLNKKLSIDDLQQITKIQKRYLEAIEGDHFDSIPGTFYVRAFIRQVAEAVGEDGDELVDIFDGKDMPQEPEKIVPEPIQVSRQEVHEEEGPSKVFWTSLPMIILGLVALSIIAVVVIMMLEDNRAKPIITPPSTAILADSSASIADSSSSAAVSTSETASSTSGSSEEQPATVSFDSEANGLITMTAREVASPAVLTFKGTTSTCWVGVQVNGSYIYQYTLTAGDEQTAEIPEGTKTVVITLGASENATVSLNGEELDVNPNNTATISRTITLTLDYQE